MVGKCQFCGKPATVSMTQIVNGKATVMCMCSECAAKRGLFDKEELTLAMLSSLSETLFAGMKIHASLSGLICSQCGCTPMSFKETGRLGCPNCYKDLRLLIDGIVESSQKGGVHKGKGPRSLTAEDLDKICPMSTISSYLVDTPVADISKKGTAKKKKSVVRRNKCDELREKLKTAISEERYEDAAKLRDELNACEHK
jgi:protein arginine kinase activator